MKMSFGRLASFRCFYQAGNEVLSLDSIGVDAIDNTNFTSKTDDWTLIDRISLANINQLDRS